MSNTSALQSQAEQCSGVGQWNNQAELFPSVKLIHFQLIPINFTGVDNLSFSTALHNFISRSLALTGSAEQHPQELRLFVSRKLHHRWEILGYTLRTAMTCSLLTQSPVGLLRSSSPPCTCPCTPWELWQEVKGAPSAAGQIGA